MAAPESPFGAACLGQANLTHPFNTFSDSYMTMYYCVTADNFPAAIWPFYTCECSVTDHGTGNVVTQAVDWCYSRRFISVAFYGSFMILLFFMLTNCVLAVCFYFYDRYNVNQLLQRSMQSRLSLNVAFYYLSEEGLVSYDRIKEMFGMYNIVSPRKVRKKDIPIIFWMVNNNYDVD